MTTPVPPQTVEDREAERVREYGTYIALRPIQIDGVNAFMEGAPVPIGHVESGKVPADAVAKTTTKAGRQAAGIEEKG